MKHLARAVVESFAFLELSDDDTVDPDDAVSAMEGLSAILSECSTAERKALATAAAAALKEEQSSEPREESLEFYSTFIQCLFEEE